jgi:anthrone oxygenase-like protein
MLEFSVRAVSFLLALFFAAAWGAHLFYATVVFPVQASEPSKFMTEWVASPYAIRVFGFWRRLVSCLYTVASIALVLAFVTGIQTRLYLAVAGICGLIHMTMVFTIFVPINLKLGLDPGGPGISSLDARMVRTLVQRWGRWNYVRVAVETVGLIASLCAFKVS